MKKATNYLGDTRALAAQTPKRSNDPPEAKAAEKMAAKDEAKAEAADVKVAEVSKADAKADRAAEVERARKLVAEADAEEAKKTKPANRKGSVRNYPDVEPRDKQIVLATKRSRTTGPNPFMAQYRKDNHDLPVGAFYSNRNGSYSVFEGEVDTWTEAPEM